MEQQGSSGGVNESDSDDEPLIKIAKRPLGQLSSPAPSSISASSNNADAGGDSSQSKSLSAYAHFFNDTQQSIRKKNSAATFEEVSQVVKSMWESLDANTKSIYQQKAEEDSKQVGPSTEGNHSEQKSEQSTPDTMDGDHLPHTDTVTDVVHPVLDETIKNSSDHLNAAEPTIGTNLKSSEKPIIVAKLVSQNQIITLGSANKIRVRAKPKDPDPATTLNNIKGITIIRKPATTEPASFSVETSQPPTKVFITTQVNREILQKVPTENTVSASSIPSPGASSTTANRPKSPVDQQAREPTPTASPPGTKICKNNGCDKPAVKHKKGDDDFCSSKCIVVHCRERFKAWVAAKN